MYIYICICIYIYIYIYICMYIKLILGNRYGPEVSSRAKGHASTPDGEVATYLLTFFFSFLGCEYPTQFWVFCLLCCHTATPPSTSGTHSSGAH